MRNKARWRHANRDCFASALFVIKFNCAAADRNYCPSQISRVMFFNFGLDVFLSRAPAAACSPIKADKEISPLSHTVLFFAKRLILGVNKILCILNIRGVS